MTTINKVFFYAYEDFEKYFSDNKLKPLNYENIVSACTDYAYSLLEQAEGAKNNFNKHFVMHCIDEARQLFEINVLVHFELLQSEDDDTPEEAVVVCNIASAEFTDEPHEVDDGKLYECEFLLWYHNNGKRFFNTKKAIGRIKGDLFTSIDGKYKKSVTGKGFNVLREVSPDEVEK